MMIRALTPTRASSSDLVAGKYWVQVRHYNRKTGMGNYTVKVRKT